MLFACSSVLRLYFFRQRAAAAFFAMAFRRAADSFAARAFPPFCPPNRPSATAAAFLPSWVNAGGVSVYTNPQFGASTVPLVTRMTELGLTLWQQAVLAGIHRFSARHQTRLIPRTQLLAEELPSIVAHVGSKGATPKQTLSRVLQEFRRMGVLHHVERGVDLLLDAPIIAEAEDFPDAALDIAIEREQLQILDVPTGDAVVLARRRRGQARLRQHALTNYAHQCALCDVALQELLVASHVVRWTDDSEARGRLANILCLCRMHDALFENGYVSIADDFGVLRRPGMTSAVVRYLQQTADRLRIPHAHVPATLYLRQHRRRTGFEPAE
jgi:hypothetical protein